MSAPASVLAAPLADFLSWGTDTLGKLIRNEINDEQAWAEVEARRTECMTAKEQARVRNLSDRALLDEAARRKFAPLAAPAETPPIVAPTEPPHG